MFVSVVLDPSSMDSAKSLSTVLTHLGFKKIQRACWEHTSVSEQLFSGLKKEIDRVTDYYDTIRIYQYPVDGMFAITELSKKKWKRCVLRAPQHNI